MAEEPARQAAVVTVSDGVARGVREDASGRAVAELLERSGFAVVRREVVPDDRPAIERALRDLAAAGVGLVVTTGGTGLGPRDVTPEATRAVLEREAPGLAEAMRAAGRGTTPFAALSRGLVGSVGRTLVLNLPGSARGAVESLSAVLPVLPHALDLLAGRTEHGPAGPEGAARPAHLHAGAGPGPAGGSVEEELAARRARGEEVVLATAVRVEGEPPCRVGQKLILGRSGALAGTLGCAEFDDAAVADAPAVLEAGVPRTATYVHDLGTVEVFLEPHLRRPTLLVLSATPVALQLSRWGRELGFEPVLVEPRAERVTAAHRAAARVEASLEGVGVDADTSAVLTDHDAPYVAEALATLLRSPARFVGVMGSARHVGPHVARLRELGFTEEELARIRTPVGLDLGARTVEEIALSILGALVADRRGASGGWLDRRQG
ncbi:MAG TPA: molybdenum cofactor synthesis domain-containing protein [Actinomycetota bacterium]|nr:molybdenum cofactor synthesis domain-containing protein [Actinomycetota bacterium]